MAALSVFLEARVAKESLIKRFLVARDRATPVKKDRFPPWDLMRVLEALSRHPFEPLEEVSFKFLIIKISFLLAITTAKRVGDLQGLLIKEPFLLILPDIIDVRRCLLTYLQRVKEFRRSNHLLILFSGPRKGLQASKSSVSRWIRQAITIAYESSGIPVPAKLKAHSTRALATSWAEKAGASWEQICSAATWSSQDTFLKHYYRSKI